ncbi:hypothetical protein PsYK624_132410 [Phanerochaete sordida]|uniref:Uncharacterized protein n=1 Tax=Phanerochaete sordida TaxID=48140 RepID=A0A9P3LIZ3_9APHY|nr:hypothetical protein PsYK624_132410 [Phanerochaete sordida]
MATVNVTLPVDVAPIAAPLLFTTLIHWYLYGALAVQVYLYYHAFPHDALPTQGLVYSLFAAGSAQMALGTRAAFRAYASHFGDTAVLAQRGWLAGPVLGGLVTAAVQLYYAQHVHALGRSRSLQILTSSLALTQGAAALVAGAQRAHGANDAVSTAVWLAACAACDVAIACAMLTLFLCPRTPASTAAAAPPAARASRAVRLVVASGVLTGASYACLCGARC